MIENFEKIKKELSELASVINSFKSEAVQLRLIELILGGLQTGETSDTAHRPRKHESRGRQRRRQSKGAKPVEANKSQKSRSSSGTGAVSTLVSVYGTNFFTKSRTIGDILEHCETNLARKIKANEISGKLGRMVRNGELKRTKNADGQYEYTKT